MPRPIRLRQPDAHISLPTDQILLGDCLEVLESLPDASVDLIFADPPYNLQLSSELLRPNNTVSMGFTRSGTSFPAFPLTTSFSRAWLTACRHVLKPTGPSG